MKLVDVTTPAPREQWWQILESDSHAMVSQTPDWLDSICAVGPFRDASRLYVFDDGRRIVMPLAMHRYLPGRLTVQASWPFDWETGGPVTNGPIDERHSCAVYADLAGLPALQTTVRPGPLASAAWRSTPAAFKHIAHPTHVVDLSEGFERLWSTRFRSNARTGVRKARKSGVRVEVDRSGRLLPIFDDLYRQSVARWAARQHEPLALARLRSNRANPPRKLREVAARLGERFALWVAWSGETPVAASIVLRYGESAMLWRSAMNVELAGPVRANDLLQSMVIEDACMAGCSTYHMGESRSGSPLATFKARFGAQELSSSAYRIERIPLTDIDRKARAAAKKVLRFHDI